MPPWRLTKTMQRSSITSHRLNAGMSQRMQQTIWTMKSMRIINISRTMALFVMRPPECCMISRMRMMGENLRFQAAMDTLKRKTKTNSSNLKAMVRPRKMLPFPCWEKIWKMPYKEMLYTIGILQIYAKMSLMPAIMIHNLKSSQRIC